VCSTGRFRELIFADAQQLSTQLERLLHPLFRMSNMQATTVIRQSYVFVCVICVIMHMHYPMCVQEADTTRQCS
jgi:dephospho-CoA kinase